MLAYYPWYHTCFSVRHDHLHCGIHRPRARRGRTTPSGAVVIILAYTAYLWHVAAPFTMDADTATRATSEAFAECVWIYGYIAYVLTRQYLQSRIA